MRTKPLLSSEAPEKKRFIVLALQIILLLFCLCIYFLDINEVLGTILETVFESDQSLYSSKVDPTDFYTWNDDGCQVWPKPSSHARSSFSSSRKSNYTDDHDEDDSLSTSPPAQLPLVPPSGIVITLARHRGQGAANTMDLLCSKLPTQLTYFVKPHQTIDMLILVDLEGYNISNVAQCLDLIPMGREKGKKGNEELHEYTWNNLDNTSITTYLHAPSPTSTSASSASTPTTAYDRKAKIYLADFVMPYPNYIAKNMSYLEQPMIDCKVSYDYVQGVRFYSDSALHLQILQSYDYMIKMDLDVEFKAHVPFHLLWDMKLKGGIFGHTGHFPDGMPPCTKDFKNVMRDFVSPENMKSLSPWKTHWKGYIEGKACSAGLVEFDRAVDYFYTNFVIMKRSFFQSKPILEFGRLMNEYDPGYFRYRWGDQLFFHTAMGMVLGPDFRDHVVDYTELRCRRFPTCWYYWLGDGEATFCSNAGGIFYHGKRRNRLGKFNPPKTPLVSPMKPTPFASPYQHDCEGIE